MNAMFGIDRWGGRGPLTLAGINRAFSPNLVWVTFPGALPQAGMKWAVGPYRPAPTAQPIPARVGGPRLVAANRDLITRFEKKIQATLARIWGETKTT
jgi:hypothetical protein